MPEEEKKEETRSTALAKLSRWVERLPPDERELPYRIIEGKPTTPSEMVTEVEERSSFGWSVVAEEEAAVKPEVTTTLIVERLKRRVEMLKKAKIDPAEVKLISWGGPFAKGYSILEVLAEVEAESDVGKTYVENQKSYFEYLESLKEEE